MLTTEMLRQNSLLSGLSDEQISAISEMSKNDENTVIGTKIGALHGQYDNDILSVSGVKKKDGEKSYDYAKRVLTEYKSKIEAVSTIEKELESSKALVTELQAKLEKGIDDDTLRKQLSDTKSQVTQLQAQLQAKDAELTSKKSEFETALVNTHVDYAFKAATAGIKFKSGITEPVQKTLLNAAKAEILAKGTPEFMDDNGSKKLVIRDTNGNIINNPKNNLNPYTIEELVMETSLKDVIDNGRQQTGGGTGPGKNTSNSTVSIDLSNVKSQVEADKAIESYLLANGITRDSQEFSDKSLAIRTENNVAELPLR